MIIPINIVTRTGGAGKENIYECFEYFSLNLSLHFNLILIRFRV